MPQLIQRYPRGLTGLLGIPSSESPRSLADQVVGIVDAGRHYDDSMMVRASSTVVGSALAVGFRPLTIGTFATAAVAPQGNVYLWHYTWGTTNLLPGGEVIDFALAINQSGTSGPPMLLTDYYTWNGGAGTAGLARGVSFFDRPIPLLPTDELGIYVRTRTGVTAMSTYATVWYSTPNP